MAITAPSFLPVQEEDVLLMEGQYNLKAQIHDHSISIYHSLAQALQ
jgi:hypothetical protein